MKKYWGLIYAFGAGISFALLVLLPGKFWFHLILFFINSVAAILEIKEQK
jgi:membrane protein implicated in regulation of membrane protease activity